jgi:hypothetical protein
MEPAATERTNRVREQLESAFPAGIIQRVEVLEYGDDRSVEPGETAVRLFINRADRPEGREGDEETVRAFEQANRATIRKLRDDLPGFIGWIEFVPDGPVDAARPPGPILKLKGRAGSATNLDEGSEELTPVMTRLGPADLSTVDTLITAGIGNSRAEVIRWALGRIREHPAYSQLQARVREIDELKAQF